MKNMQKKAKQRLKFWKKYVQKSRKYYSKNMPKKDAKEVVNGKKQSKNRCFCGNELRL